MGKESTPATPRSECNPIASVIQNSKLSGWGRQDSGIKRDSADSQTTKKIVLRKECQECKRRVQVPLKRVKHFELRGDKKRKGQMIQF